MVNFQSIKVPAYEFQFNLVVCPVPSHENKKVGPEYFNICINFVLQDCSSFFILKDNGANPIETGQFHWLSLLPNHNYFFLPSFEINRGHIEVLDYTPYYIDDFHFCFNINEVNIFVIVLLLLILLYFSPMLLKCRSIHHM